MGVGMLGSSISHTKKKINIRMAQPKIKSVGIDMVEISRFKDILKNKKHFFLKKVFFENELNYCFSYKDVATHLAGHFAAKEAVSKALGVKKFPFAEIEIKHDKNGAPIAYKSAKKLPILLSITHTKALASAIAIR